MAKDPARSSELVYVPEVIVSKLQKHMGSHFRYQIEIRFVLAGEVLERPRIEYSLDSRYMLTVDLKLDDRSAFGELPFGFDDEGALNAMHYDVRRELMLHYPDWWVSGTFGYSVTARMQDAEALLRNATNRRPNSRKD
jgi:hypothetical protein